MGGCCYEGLLLWVVVGRMWCGGGRDSYRGVVVVIATMLSPYLCPQNSTQLMPR